MSHPTTIAPSVANALASTRPHPFATPVTNTTLLLSDDIGGSLPCSCSRSGRFDAMLSYSTQTVRSMETTESVRTLVLPHHYFWPVRRTVREAHPRLR